MIFRKKRKKVDNQTESVSRETLKKQIGEQILDGKGGDVDIRTIRTKRWERTYRYIKVLGVVGVIAFFVGQNQYHLYSISNSTPFGTQLTYTNTKASVQLKAVYTDKNREVTIIQLGYTDTSRLRLSSKGTNYGINFVVDKETDLPSDLETSYSLLGTEGDGYLIIKGKLKEEAYQLVVLNRFSFDKGSGEMTTNSNTLDLEKKSIESILSSQTMNSADKNGLFNFDKLTGTNQDIINFRVNPYSKNTIVYEGSFLNSDGDVDYNKIVQETGVKEIIATLEDSLEVAKENVISYENAITEYTDRLLLNPDDTKASDSLKTAQDSLLIEQANIEQIKQQIEVLNTTTFDKDSFTEANTEYNVIVR